MYRVIFAISYYQKAFIALLFILGIFNASFAQVKAPQITPLSPNAASLFKYTELPVNLYTGIPSISIPIYEIKSGSLSVPISLSYHAGGNRYEDQASWVGLGWTLNAGGSINRNVRGIADEIGILNPGNSFLTTLPACPTEYFTNVLNKVYDVQPDEFSYNMPGKSGRFIFRSGVAQPVTIPYDPIRITYPSYTLPKIEIQDENGQTFRFGNYNNQNISVTEITSGGSGAFREDAYPSSWLLTEMESADLGKKITFNYVPGESNFQKNTYTQSITVLDKSRGRENQPNCPPPATASVSGVTTTNLVYSTYTQYLSEIVFDNGKVQFIQSSGYRTDLYEKQRSLEYIKVFSLSDGAYKLVKTVHLIYSYFKKRDNNLVADWKLKLDKIQVLDNLGIVIEEYGLQYFTDVINVTNQNALDYWGYYNGKQSNTNLIPQQTIEYNQNDFNNTPIQIGGADRAPDSTYMTEGVLRKIIYPTGGYSEFEFESNRYINGAVSKIAGGLRIKKIVANASSTSTPIIKTYKYGLNEDGNGVANFNINLGFFLTTHREIVKWQACPQPPICDDNYYTIRNYNSMSGLSIDGADGSPVLYPYVTEYMIGSSESINNGRTEYVYDLGSPIPDNSALISGPGASEVVRLSNQWLRGYLTKKTIYTSDNLKVSESITSYQTLHQINETSGLLIHEDDHMMCAFAGQCAQFQSLNPYSSNYYPIYSGVRKVSSSTDIIYDLGDANKSVTNVTNYVYDPNYLQPIEVSTNLKKLQTGYEEQRISFTKYPFDYTFTSTPVGTEAQGIKLLQDKNISTAPIEQYTVRKFRNPTTWQSDVIDGTITTYRNNKPYPDKIWQIETLSPITSASFGTGSSIFSNSFNKNSAYKEKLAFNSYDIVGNVTEFNKINDVKNTFLWDYANTYPVAEITGASNANIAYSGFEAENKGNWTYSGTPILDATTITGKKVYVLNGSNNIIRTGLSTSITYIVSYWLKSNSPLTIAGTQGKVVVGRNLGSWKYFEHRITGQTQIVISGVSSIDELRLYPVGSLMTTYTHEPLLGLSSKCDHANRTSYFEYDNFGRLQIIRDQDKNIIKTLEYKYKIPE